MQRRAQQVLLNSQVLLPAPQSSRSLKGHGAQRGPKHVGTEPTPDLPSALPACRHFWPPSMAAFSQMGSCPMATEMPGRSGKVRGWLGAYLYTDVPVLVVGSDTLPTRAIGRGPPQQQSRGLSGPGRAASPAPSSGGSRAAAAVWVSSLPPPRATGESSGYRRISDVVL